MIEYVDTHAPLDQPERTAGQAKLSALVDDVDISSTFVPKASAVVLVLLLIWFVAINIAHPTGPPDEPVSLLMMGALFIQPSLFAIWMVMGPGPAVKRIPATFTSFMLLMLAGEFNIWELLERGDAIGAAFVIPGLALFGLTAAALCIVRWRTGWRICRSHIHDHGQSSTNQFSLKYLLGWTTVCALLLFGVRALTPIGLPGAALMIVSTLLVLLMLLPPICAPLVVLSRKPFSRLILFAPLLWGVLAWLTIETTVAAATEFDFEPDDWNEVASTVIFGQAGALIVGLTSAVVLRFADYRLAGKASVNSNAANSRAQF